MLRSIDPYRQTVVAKYDNDHSEAIQEKILSAHKAQQKWKRWTVSERLHGLETLINLLKESKAVFAEMMAREMGKPITQGIAEIEKCMALCEHYQQHAPAYLAPQLIETEHEKTTIQRQPFGVWLGIMPWNFPFWQVFRYAIPALLAGNTVLLKHSQHTTGCALAIESAIQQAWMNEGLFQVLKISSHQIDEILSHPEVAGVSLTGSEAAGRSVAALAGRNIKMSVLELGGSNAMIIDETADIEKAMDGILQGRFSNSGQSCIAAKRIIVHESRWYEIQLTLENRLKQLKWGDPLEMDTQLGPLVSEEAAEQLDKQYQRGLQQGAEILIPLQRSGALCTPAAVYLKEPTNVLWQEETFGPLAVFMTYDEPKKALQLRAHEHYALGTCIYTAHPEQWMKKSHLIHEPMIVFNNIVKSSPHLPFGGLKKSGFGTELGAAGIQQFTFPQVVSW
jgi:succinate-semialdehyde dehydrogenase/glutarate-semialdehyde dehydrogenase